MELFSVPTEGPASLGERINTPLVSGGNVRLFRVSPDGERAVYVADQEVNDVQEIFSVPVAGPASSCIKLNKTLTAGGDVIQSNYFYISGDSNRVVYQADQDTDEKWDIYSVPIGGPADDGVMLGGLGLEGDVIGFGISPDSARVVYLADPAFFSISHVHRLFTIPIEGPLIKVGTLNDWPNTGYKDADVQNSFQISPDSQFVVYATDQETDNAFELYRIPIVGPAGTEVKLNGSLVTGGGLDELSAFFDISPDSHHVVYIADQDTDEVKEIFVSYWRGPAAREWTLYR
jgi:Tol biopolymer transport system component